ncbi:hypothetical protein EV421DRAFT_1266986 [Armillaria borealis]|uniref:Uncharacterized protein n=1 Tax=Armillaria borealis TaxID=47425 RepID=A0AA39J3M2_9AGAR|nr:hypothetical protein EV421DRAFT_1266986 [Armillaria borealis]
MDHESLFAHRSGPALIRFLVGVHVALMLAMCRCKERRGHRTNRPGPRCRGPRHRSSYFNGLMPLCLTCTCHRVIALDTWQIYLFVVSLFITVMRVLSR